MRLILLALVVCLEVAAMTDAAAQVQLDSHGRTAQDLARDATAKPGQVIAFSEVSKGMVIADILGGGGYYSELLSQIVGKEGKVYLHNNKAYLRFVGNELKARMKANRLVNVIDYKREIDSLGFTDNSLDAIFFILGYHDLYHSSKRWDVNAEHFLDQLTRALKPGGLLLVVDHSAPKGSNIEHTQKLHRIDEEYVKKELLGKGFTLHKASQILRNKKDSRLMSAFHPEIRRRTDRFVLLLKKDF
jgi:predicted methyltransferase